MQFSGKVLGLVVPTLIFSAAVPPQPQGGFEDPIAHLTAPDAGEREQASHQIVTDSGKRRNALLDVLRTVSVNPSRSFVGPFALTVKAIGEIKLRDATGPLTPLIEFQLDPRTKPRLEFEQPQNYYPVAEALVKIGGGKRLTRGILNRLTRPADETTLRVHAWVLEQTLGTRICRLVVQDELATSYAVLQRIGGAKSSIKTTNLERVKELFASEEALIEWPADANPPVAPVPRAQRGGNNPF